MSRALFMAKLKQGLADLPQAQIDEIAADYEHHFVEAIGAGQTEDEVAAALGDPVRLAQELRGDGQPPLSAAQDLMPQPAPANSASKAGTLVMLLAFLAAIGLAAAAYYVMDREDGRPPGASAGSASMPASPPLRANLAAPGGARIVISGGQVLDLGTLAQERIEIMLDGGGHAVARGRVRELVLHIDGSGSADLGALQAQIVHVEISGTGNAEVWGAQMADITITGSGMVRLKAKPKTLKQSVTGTGKVVLPN